MNTVRSEKMFKKIGPGDKTSHEGDPLFRADAIPDFVTPDWVEKNIGLTNSECRAMSKAYAEVMPSWTGEEASDGTFCTKFSRDIGIVNFVTRGMGAIPVKKRRKGHLAFLSMISEMIFDRVSTDGMRTKSLEVTKAREILAEQGEWECLSQIMFIEILFDMKPDHLKEMLGRHNELKKRIGPFWNSYSEKKKKVDRIGEQKEEEWRKKREREKQKKKKEQEKQRKKKEREKQKKMKEREELQKGKKSTGGTKKPEKEKPTFKKERASVGTGTGVLQTMISRIADAEGAGEREELVALIANLESLSQGHVEFGPETQEELDAAVETIVSGLSEVRTASEMVAAAMRKNKKPEVAAAFKRHEEAEGEISQAITDILASLDSGGGKGSIEPEKEKSRPTDVVELEPVERPDVGDEVIEREGGHPEVGGIDEAATKGPDDQLSSAVNDLVTQLLDRGNLGLAYHVGRFGEQHLEPGLSTFPVPILRLLAISGSIKGVLGDRIQATQSIVQDVSRILEKTDEGSELARAHEALVIAGALEPALFCLESMATSIFVGKGQPYLYSLAGLFPGIFTIIETVSEIPTFGVEVTPSNIRGLQEDDIWVLAVKKSRRDMGDWFERTKHKKLIGPATLVWQHLVKPRGPIGSVVGQLIDEKNGAAVEARAFVTSLRELGEVDALIKETDHRIRGSRNPVEARAVRSLRKLIAESVANIDAYLGLLESKPDSLGGHEQRVIQDLRTKLSTAIKSIIPEIDDWLTDGNKEKIPSFLIASIRCLHRSLKVLLDLIEGNTVKDVITTTEEEHLGIDLPFVRGVHFLGAWEPDKSQPDVFVRVIKEFLAQGRKTAAEAFTEQMKDNNHIATAHLLDRMRYEGREDIGWRRLTELSNERKQAIVTARSKLRVDLEAAGRGLDRAMGMSLITDNDFLQYQDGLNAIEPNNLPSVSYDDDQRRSIRIVDFPMAHRVIDEVNNQIAEHELARCEDLRQDLQILVDGKKCNTADAESIGKMIDEGDLLLVETCLSTVADTGTLPTRKAGTSHIREFFPNFVNRVNENLKKEELLEKEGAEELQRGGKVAGIDYSGVERSRMESAVTLLKSWTSLGGANGKGADSLRQIMEAIGFAVLEPGIEPVPKKLRNSKYPEFTMKCKPIEDRSICPVHQYGSGANGRYRLILVTRNATVKELVDTLAANRGMVTFLVYRGLLTSSQRKAFIKEIYGVTGVSGLLIDDTTILYLCKISDFRLPVMFQITLPFTKVNPYWIERGKTPVEMFYGRETELAQIVDPVGSNLVYGGRMLGKTALLYQIEGLHDRPRMGSHVIYQDLKFPENILGQKKAQEFRTDPGVIWELIARLLTERNLIKAETKEDFMVDQVIQKVRAWLRDDPDRRLLLLLDEADNFLKTDSLLQHTNVGALKNLMDVTGARFKVVMAGLHDVQRTIGDPNSPIARMGLSVCVGPLTGADRLEAYNLVREPLSACGYEFESSDLVMKILSQTNSYPSLVQVFCNALLAYVGKQQSLLKAGPPYLITKSILDDASQQETMRNQIVARFEETLRLDPRYAMIAHVISLETIYDKEENRIVEGYDTRYIRKEVLSYGSGPFGEDTSSTIFSALLDEMVGLGLLERIDGRYKLRSTTILTMMGSRNQIEDRIAELATWEAQVHYDPESNHRVFGDDPLLRSPLTIRQEAELFRDPRGKQPNLFLVFGSRLAGIDDVADVIERRATKERWPIKILDGARQVQEVHNVAKRYASRDHLRPIIVVPRTVPWSSVWVSKALDWPEIKRGKVRLFFLGGGNAALDWVQDGKPGVTNPNVQVVSVSPWSTSSVKQWIEDEGLIAAFKGAEGLHDLIAETGLLTEPLMTVRRIIKDEPDLSTALDLWREASRTEELVTRTGIPRDLIPFMKHVGDFAVISDGNMTIPREEIELIASDDEFDIRVDLPTLVDWGDLMAIWEPAPEDHLRLSRLIFEIAKTAS